MASKQPKGKNYSVPATGGELRELTCGEQSPKASDLVRVRCNRIEGHPPPHRKLRARDFVVTHEWDGFTYTIRPGAK